MYYYINLYLIGSFLGYLLETFLKYFFFHSMNNGILFGPWIPVYGFGILIALIVEKKIFQLKIRNIYKFILSFFVIVILNTILEEIGGVLIELISHKTFWNYSNKLFNLGPYISLEMSLLWGILSLIFVSYVVPAVNLLIEKIPRTVTIFVLGIQIVDFIFTLLI